jgi:undecaprenyl diphosphate synthase
MSEKTVEQTSIKCIGFILDGNRRWAKERNLPTLEGHRKGYENLKEAARWVRDRNIPHMVAYAFSTENWNRSTEEVEYLMGIFREAIRDADEELGTKEGLRVRFIGQRERFAPDMQEGMRDAEEKTKNNTRGTLWICLSYGGRAEIVDAARAAAARGEITEQTIRENMWSAEMPDPEIIIRTGSAARLSNFLLWQAAYSELFFIKLHWPDFTEETLDAVLREYATRTRNFGV